MTDPHDERDPRLAELLADAVSDVEPTHRLDSIRNRTKVTPMSARRPWLFAVGGAVVATAAVITAIAVTGGNLTGADDAPDPAGSTAPVEPTPSETQTGEATPSESPSATPGTESTVAVYFAGDTPSGPRLYREFQTATTGGVPSDAVLYAATATVDGTADDPDYGTLWPEAVAVQGAGIADDGKSTITVNLVDPPADRPADLTAAEAEIAVQQVVYSVQAALGEGRVPVRLMGADGPVDTILGVDVSGPLSAGGVLDTLALVSLSSPGEGEVVTGGSLDVSGVANSFEANVVVRLQPVGSDQAVAEQPFTAEGWMGERLFPFSGTLDLAGIAPGEYLLVASTDDPSGGAEGTGPHVDTRTITVE